MVPIDRSRLAALLADEQAAYAAANPRSQELYAAAGNLFGRVPMTWMNKWSGGFPLYLDHARGARITDVDGHTYVDFALGDTAAMAGHSPEATIKAVATRYADQGGATTMLPTADAQWVGAELELQPVGNRCEPLGHPAGAPGDRAAEDSRLRLLLSRVGR